MVIPEDWENYEDAEKGTRENSSWWATTFSRKKRVICEENNKAVNFSKNK